MRKFLFGVLVGAAVCKFGTTRNLGREAEKVVSAILNKNGYRLVKTDVSS